MDKPTSLKKEYFIVLSSLILFLLVLFNLKNKLFLSNFDVPISLFMESVNNNFLTYFAVTIDYLFEPIIIFFVSLLIVTFLVYKKREKYHAKILFLAMVLNILVIYFLKIIINRPRPDNALLNLVSSSFPSGHTTTTIIFLGFFILLALNNLKSRVYKILITSILLFSILIIALSRVYLNVHWISDIIGSLFLGISIFFASIIIVEKLSNK